MSTIFTTERLSFVVFTVLLTALGLRLVFFLVSCLYVLPTGDEGLLMLQAKHIWQGKEVPLLFWAQPYTFPIESYVNAPFTAILPSNAFGARLLAWFWGLASCILALAIIRRMGTFRDVWPAYLMVLFPSAYWLTIQSAYAPPSYPSYIGLFFLAILFARLSQHVEHASKRILLVGLSGLSAGLACSVALLAVPLFVALGLFFLMRGRFRASLRQGFVFVLGGIVGLIPQIMARLSIPGAYAEVSGSRSLVDALHVLWQTAIKWTLSGTFGIRYPLFPDLTRNPASSVTDFADMFHVVWLVVFAAVVILGCFRLIQNTRKNGWLELDFVHVFSIVTVSSLVLFGLSDRAQAHSYRYLLPVVMSFPFQIAYLYRYMKRPVRCMIAGLIIFLAGINLLHSVQLMQVWRTPDFGRIHADVPSLQPVIDLLDQNDIRFAYGSWFSAHRLTYATDERIISGQYYNERFHGWPTPYKERIDSEEKVAFILDWSRKLNPKYFEAEMARVFPEVLYRKSKAGSYMVYYDFQSLPRMPEEEIDPDHISVDTSHNQGLSFALQDQDPINHWYSGNRQETGMYFDITLAHKKPVTRINLFFNHDDLGQAHKLNLLVEKDNELVMLKEGIEKDSSLIEMKNSHPVVGNMVQQIHIPATSTERLRIEIAEPDPHVHWSIGEVKLFRLKDEG